MRYRQFSLWIICFGLVMTCTGVQAQSGETIVTGTSLLAEMVQQMLGQTDSLHTLLPPNMCPGHYDMRTGDLKAVTTCRILVLQAWQRQMPNIEAVIRSSKISEDRIKILSVPGNWMIPATRSAAARELGTLLSGEFPEKKNTIEAGTKKIIAEAEQTGAWGLAQIRPLIPEKIHVLCNEQQMLFVRWLGFSNVQSFGRPEGLSVAQIEELTSQAKQNRTALVIDNLQSGDTKMGESLARDTGALHVVLSNFPGAEKGYDRWEQTFRQNVERIVSALTQWQKTPHE